MMSICRIASKLLVCSRAAYGATRETASACEVSSFIRSFSALSFKNSSPAPVAVLPTLSERCLSVLATSANVSETNRRKSLLAATAPVVQPVRTRIMFSRNGGRAESVQDVVNRFFRLHNGLWIRPCQGRNRGKYRKNPRRVWRLQQHVVCNRTQCQMLDKMVEPYFRDKHHYVNDPYTPYHRLSNLPDHRYQPPKFLP